MLINALIFCSVFVQNSRSEESIKLRRLENRTIETNFTLKAAPKCVDYDYFEFTVEGSDEPLRCKFNHRIYTHKYPKIEILKLPESEYECPSFCQICSDSEYCQKLTADGSILFVDGQKYKDYKFGISKGFGDAEEDKDDGGLVKLIIALIICFGATLFFTCLYGED